MAEGDTRRIFERLDQSGITKIAGCVLTMKRQLT